VIALLIGSVLSVHALGFPPTQSFEKQNRITPRFKSVVSAVYLDVVVTGPSQLFLPGLTVDDFEVFEDGVRQEVSFFSSDDVAPITLVLLLDASTSIAGSVRAIKKASSNLVREMSSRDKAAVVVFSDTILKSTHFTALPDPLLKAIRSLYPRGSTALYDAILHSLDKLSRIEGRKALLVFTDGSDSRPMDGGSKSSAKEVIEAGKMSEVTIYTVGFIGNGSGVNQDFLTRLASETGGRAFYPVNVDHLHRSFVAIGQELHTSYRIAYTPKNDVLDGTWRAIKVRIQGHEDLIVRTRQGYYALPSGSR
jgi:Ca-activated chloride channel family protein